MGSKGCFLLSTPCIPVSSSPFSFFPTVFYTSFHVPMGEANDKPDSGELKIYFLPNLFTAGNLFCGFLALTKIVGVDLDVANPDYGPIREALWLILLGGT